MLRLNSGARFNSQPSPSFADLAECFTDLGLSVLDAKLHTSDAGRSIDIFIISRGATCQPVTASDDQEQLLRGLEQLTLEAVHKQLNVPTHCTQVFRIYRPTYRSGQISRKTNID